MSRLKIYFVFFLTGFLFLDWQLRIGHADTGSFQFLPQTSSRGVLPIQQLIQIRGQVWAATAGGLLVYDLKTQAWSMVWDEEGLMVSSVNGLAYQPPYLWAAGEMGLFRIDLRRREYLHLTEANGLKARNVRFVTADTAFVWIGYWEDRHEMSNEVTCFSHGGRIIRHWANPEEAGIFQMAADAGSVWLLTAGRLGRLDARTGKLEQWTPLNLSKAYQLYRQHASMTVDNAYVYVGGGVGEPQGSLLRFDKMRHQWTSLDTTFVFPIARSPGLLWVGASYDLLGASRFVLKYIKDRQTEWKKEFYYEHTAMISSILPMKNEIWIGMTNGILRWDPATREATHFRPQKAAGRSEPDYHAPVRDVCCTEREMFLWADDLYRGLLPDKNTPLAAPEKIAENIVIFSPSEDALWAGADPYDYTYEYDSEDDEYIQKDVRTGSVFKIPYTGSEKQITKIPYPEIIGKIDQNPDRIFIQEVKNAAVLAVSGDFRRSEEMAAPTNEMEMSSSEERVRGERERHLYVYKGLWKRKGDTWMSMAPETQKLPGKHLTGLVSDGAHLFAATNEGLFRLNEETPDWTQLYFGPVSHIAASSRKNFHVYLIADDKLKVFQMTESGVKIRWELPDPLKGVQKLSDHPNGVFVLGRGWLGIYDFEKGWKTIKLEEDLWAIRACAAGRWIGASRDNVYWLEPYTDPLQMKPLAFPLAVHQKKLELRQEPDQPTPRLNLN